MAQEPPNSVSQRPDPPPDLAPPERVMGWKELRWDGLTLFSSPLALSASEMRPGWAIWPKPPEPLIAVCLFMQDHRPPERYCSCGIYAHVGATPPEWRSVAALGYVVVLVQTWGRVYLHSHGWRASHARIAGVLGSDRVGRAYGVPVLERAAFNEALEPTRKWVIGLSRGRGPDALSCSCGCEHPWRLVVWDPIVTPRREVSIDMACEHDQHSVSWRLPSGNFVRHEISTNPANAVWRLVATDE